MPQTDVQAVFIQRLKQARKAMGISQAALGLEIGLPEETASTRINRYERGVSEPDLRTAEAMAKALGVSLSYLLAADERTAKLLLTFGKLSPERQEEAITMIETLGNKENDVVKGREKNAQPATGKTRRRSR